MKRKRAKRQKMTMVFSGLPDSAWRLLSRDRDNLFELLGIPVRRPSDPTYDNLPGYW